MCALIWIMAWWQVMIRDTRVWTVGYRCWSCIARMIFIRYSCKIHTFSSQISVLFIVCRSPPSWSMYKGVNSASAAYMRQWIGSTLVQIMAWRLFGAKPLPELMRTYWTLRKKFQWNLIPSTILFRLENAFKNVVWEMAAGLSSGEMNW